MMRKIRMIFTGILVLLMMLTGCSFSKDSASDRTELVYTVMELKELPQELQEIIEEHKKQEMRLSYTDGSVLYLIRGYGERPTGGYSIAIKECSEDGESILLDTLLIGPRTSEKIKEEPSWPYLVLKVENKGEREILIQ